LREVERRDKIKTKGRVNKWERVEVIIICKNNDVQMKM
jgi:hypothetical protein